MDWITAIVEAAGVLIFCAWLIVPIREFRQIFKRVNARKNLPADREDRGA